MILTYDREVTISVASSRRATKCSIQKWHLFEVYPKYETPARGPETLAEYLRMPKSKQDDLKDVGGVVYGALRDGRRKANSVLGRDILTLDLDNISAGGTQDALRRVEALGCGYCVHSTRKHEEAKPRLRVLVPLARTATADEYEPLARKLASIIGIELCDPSTFEVSRLMYWPSCCSDSQYIYTYGDKPFLDVDGLLALYKDWRDVNEWPQVPGVQKEHKRLVDKQGDPTAKAGIVGAFCRVYDVYRAMETFLPGVYEPCVDSPSRFTYTGGSTTGGALVYDDGAFLFSHHATDPCGGRLVNAFDLVRLHRFGDRDDDARPETPTNRLPSYVAMCEVAVADQAVSTLLIQERYKQATSDFQVAASMGSEAPASGKPEDVTWIQQLTRHTQTGQIQPTIDNIWLILENDPNLKGKFALNKFAGRGEVLGPLPWDMAAERRLWGDNDNYGLYWYLEKYYGLTGTGKIDGALSLHSAKHSFNDVQAYLASLKWDGNLRLDTLFVDYLGAEDNTYTRAVTRKAFTAAVARAMTPGVKYDTMLILSGPQGIGKSTLLDKMSRGWFNDSIRTFEGKDASELLQGVWIVEVSELDAFRRTDAARIKQFLSLRVDRFRAAYGRHVKEMPRCCVFFGTTNKDAYLQDETGNRRFWPVDVGAQPSTKDFRVDLDGEVDQLWAEAFFRWQIGESLYLSNDLLDTAKQAQEGHRETSPREGIVLDFLSRSVPDDWSKWTLDRRMMFWSGHFTGTESLTLVPRDRVCALEIWCEAFNGAPKDMRYGDAVEINSILKNADGWERSKNGIRCGYCGLQKGFLRRQVDTSLDTSSVTAADQTGITRDQSISVRYFDTSEVSPEVSGENQTDAGRFDY